MKRIISIVVAIAMVLSMINTFVFAAENDTLRISANSQSVKPGETAIITLTVIDIH